MNNENKLDKIAYKIFEVLAKFHMTCIMFIMVFIVLFVIACGGYKENNRVVLLVGIAVGVYVILCGILFGFYNDAPVTRVMGLVSIVECICSIVMFSLLLKNLLCRRE